MKNKKRLLVAGGIASVLAIGGTIAVNNDLLNFANEFKLGANVFEFKETFESPTNWQPCDETPKTVIATNKNDEDRYVRIKIDEYWRTKDTETSADDHTTSDLAFTWTDANEVEHRYAIINLDNQEDWEYRDGWYYYKEAIGKNESTNSPIQSVTLNCDANFVSSVTYDADHLSGESVPSDYAGATYHLYITGQISSEPWEQPGNTLYGAITSRTNNGLDTNIDFSKKAVSTDEDSNGAGLNIVASTASDEHPVYYFRGDVADNNVIWANMCWKIVRTTNTGGVKMIYNGLPTTVDDVKQCDATGSDTQISVDGVDEFTFSVNGDYFSPANVGYMFGSLIYPSRLTPKSGDSFYFSNDVSREGDTYILDTSAGQYVRGTWSVQRTTAATRYHYFCKDGASSCDSSKIGYVYYYSSANDIYYLPVNGYENIEDMKNAMFSNTTNSYAKEMIETWFEEQNLDGHIAGSHNYENDLEDTVFCNERTFYNGALAGKDSPARTDNVDFARFTAYSRIGNGALDVANNPTLDCANKNDAFTKSDTTNGNGKLAYKVGLLTADEILMAGAVSYYEGDNYLYADQGSWTMTPEAYDDVHSYVFGWNYSIYDSGGSTDYELGLRPVVSLNGNILFANGGIGTKANPYVVE